MTRASFESRVARAVADFAVAEFGAKPKHSLCLRLVLEHDGDAARPRRAPKVRQEIDQFAAYVFEREREALKR